MINLQEYTKFLSEINSWIWSNRLKFTIDEERTHFVGAPEDLRVNVVFAAPVRSYLAQTVWEDVRTEISLLESFNKDVEPYEVSSGDSFWSIAEERYGNSFYHLPLSAANGLEGLAGDTLRVGESISLPPLFELVTLPEFHILSPGDTISGLCRVWMPDAVGLCLEQVSAANPGIPLSSIFALQPIRLPESILTRSLHASHGLNTELCGRCSQQ